MDRNLKYKSLKSDLDKHGFLFMAKNKILPKDFIEANADLISSEEIWIELIKSQKHIDSSFYYEKFSSDFTFRIRVILLRKAVSETVKKISL